MAYYKFRRLKGDPEDLLEKGRDTQGGNLTVLTVINSRIYTASFQMVNSSILS